MQGFTDIVPGQATKLDHWVTRVVAPNRGVMTGPGTNTYFVGQEELVVVDPGPSDPRHIAALLAHGAGRIRWIVCTHTHFDHSPAAAHLAAVTGAEVIGMPPPTDSGHDATFAPTRIVRDGEVLHAGPFSITAVHTPGHDSHHLCFRLDQNGMLFTGDHVMQGSTVVIAPPDGDMQQYLDSLRRLLAIDITTMAPGHGHLIEEPHAEVRRLIEHRLWREARVHDAVERRGAATVEDMIDDVYPDLIHVLRRPAAQSLTAHLKKLVKEGLITEDEGHYVIASRSYGEG